MAIKGGAIVTTANGTTVVDRVQTAGPGQVNIPTEKINELGNYKSVATVRDTPDLTFSYESLDVSTETEAAITGQYAGRSVDDGAVTDDGLTSATAAFTSADVGRQVIIAGAGADGAEFVTTIESVTNGTTVVLADAVDTDVTDADVTITTNGFDLARSLPVDFANQFKAGRDDPDDPFKVIASVALPFLYLEQMSYRFGLRDNASQSGQFRGDSIFYNPGAVFVERVAGSGAANQVIATAHPAFQLGEGDHRRVLSVTAGSKRLVLGADYTEAYGAVVGGAAITTITLKDAVPASSYVRIVYSSPDAATYPQAVHPSASVKPAAVKGRDIDIYLGGYLLNDPVANQENRVGGVQGASIDWRVTIEKDEEFGNYYAVASDFDVPVVSGSLDFMPRDPADLLFRLRQMANLSDPTAVIGTSTSQPLPLDVVIRNPENSRPVKRFHVPDARFTIPGYSGRVQQKTTVSINWESDEGELLIFGR